MKAKIYQLQENDYEIEVYIIQSGEKVGYPFNVTIRGFATSKLLTVEKAGYLNEDELQLDFNATFETLGRGTCVYVQCTSMDYLEQISSQRYGDPSACGSPTTLPISQLTK